MDATILKTIIYEQHEIIRNEVIIPRDYELEENGNYVIIGLRRAGKTTLLHKVVQDLVASGVSWEQIIYINFEDERLLGFNVNDFDDIMKVAGELTDQKPFFFLDEVQIVDQWEHFARRLADAKERVYITGSNAQMLSSEIASTLGGRYLIKKIDPYSWKEFLTASHQSFTEKDLLVSKTRGQIRKKWNEYLEYGGLPEALLYHNKREYLSGVYQKIYLGDIVRRNNIRNDMAVHMLIKKMAEAVRNDVSYSKLNNTVNSVGVKVTKMSLISYVDHAKAAFLIFDVKNYFSKFSERASNPNYYFSDNGILNLFLFDKSSILLENAVAIHLHRLYGADLYFLKSVQNGIDIDFYVPETQTVYQVAYSLEGEAYEREIGGIVKLSQKFSEASRFVIITNDEERTVETSGLKIEVIPAYKYLLK